MTTTMTADPGTEARPPAVEAALGVVEMGARAATAYGRADLADRLAGTRARLVDPSFRVFVVGEFKQGKSSLVNALVGQAICPVDDDVATAVPTAVHYARDPGAAVVTRLDGPRPGTAGTAGASADRASAASDRAPIALDRVADAVVEHHDDTAGGGTSVHAVEVGVPSPLLAEGLVVVDTPGVGGLGSVQAGTTLAALPLADALLMVSDASQELTAPELEFLGEARRLCPNVLCVLTKTDFYPEWRTIRDLDVGHLRAAGVDAEVVCTSAALRAEARRLDDGALDHESGVPDLEARLRDDFLADAERLAVRAAANDVVDVASQLASRFESERRALTAEDPSQASAHLAEVQERAARLAGGASRWQQTLSDGIADLGADLDHELRARLRAAGREADEALDAADPAETWDEFEPWLRERVSQDVVATYAALHRRTRELARRVGEHFDEDGPGLAVRPDIADPSTMLGGVDVDTGIDTSTTARGDAALAALRGGYMGMLMFGMLGSMLAGLSLLNPATAAIAVVMGRKALRQERDRGLAQRRNAAKTAHRRFTDEVAFVVMKDARDTLRRVQRQLRDVYATRAAELQRTTAEGLDAARRAVVADAAAQKRRRADVEVDLERIAGLRRRARDLLR